MKLLSLLILVSLAFTGCASTGSAKNYGYGSDYNEPIYTYNGPPVNIHYSQH